MKSNVIRSIQKPNTVYSLRLRNGKFVLLQTHSIRMTEVAVFNQFRDQDDWSDFEIAAKNVLFYCFILKSVFQHDSIRVRRDLPKASDLTFPDEHVSINGAKRYCLWKGTADERNFGSLGAELSIRRRHHKEGRWSYEYTPITTEDYDRCKHLETTGLGSYGEFNERLFLCSEMGVNIDPYKEIAFLRPLDISCSVYVDIISGKIRPGSGIGY